MYEVYHVTADHVAPAWAFKRTPVHVHKDVEGGYYATHNRLGCSRTYPTQERAIRAFFADHACTNVRIEGPVK